MRASTISVQLAEGSLPKPIGRVLRRLGRHVRASSLLRGLGTTALVVAGATALGMAADFAWVLPRSARWATWGAWLTAGLVAFAATVLVATFRRILPLDLAAVAEQGHPGLGEHLTGAVALLGGGSRSHGSPRLIAAVADRAAEHVVTVETSRVIPWRRALSRLLMGVVALGLLAAPLLWWPDSYRRLARHFLMPWADLERVGRHVLTVAPGDKVLPVGADLSVSASIRSRLGMDSAPTEAWLEWTIEGDPGSHRVPMPVAPKDASNAATIASPAERGFDLTLPRLARSISYRVDSGSVTSPRFTVTVLEPPAVIAISARVEPPAYTKLPVTTPPDASRIEAFEGSRVTLDVKTSRPVQSIEVEWPGDPAGSAKVSKVAASLARGRERGSVTVDATFSGPFAVSLRDEIDLASRPDQPRRVVVRGDAPPVIAVRGPEGVNDIGPQDTLALAVAARDDIAVASVELHYAIDRADSSTDDPETGQLAVSLPGIGSRSARGQGSLTLESLGLKPGDSLSIRVRAADNRPAPRGPNVVWSPFQSFLIQAAAVPLRVRMSMARSSGLRAKIESLKKDVVADREKTEQLRQAADAVRRGDGEWDESRRHELEAREAAARANEDRLRLLARDLAAQPGLRQLSQDAQQIAEVEAEAARARLDQARRQGDPAGRHADLERAVGRMAAVNERLDDLGRKFDVSNQARAEIGRLGELARRQEKLADLPEAAGDRAQADRIQAEQIAVRDDLDALLKKTPALRGLVLDEQTREAERLAGQARALADRQRNESRRPADLSKRATELKNLVELERELETDARKLAVDVDQPLAENGRGRINTEAIRQAVEPIERGDVEGARERLEGAENELRRLTRDLEDVPADPKALAGRLFRRQDALNREIDEALRSVAGKKLTDEEKKAFAARMKPLAEREQAIAKLTKTIQPPPGKEGQQRFPHDAARDAVAKTARSAETLPSQKTKEIEDRKNEARQALERLANELHDPWRRQEPTRQKFDEARRISNEVAEEIARHVRETNPRPDRLATTAAAATELAQRLHDTADKQSRAVAALEAMEPEPRALPQRDRARRRAVALAGALRDLRDPAKRERARSVLSATEVEAHAAMDRLEQKLSGRVPADDLAEELAADQRAIAQAAATEQPNPDARDRAKLAAGQHALAVAIRNLPVPDAALAQAEAIRLADRAAQVLADAKQNADAGAALREAAGASQAFADRLADRQTPRERAAALAHSQRALNLPEAQADPARAAQHQNAIAGELARLPVAKKEAASERVDRAAKLTERALATDDDHPASGRPDPEALAVARTQAAVALEALAAASPEKTSQPEKPPASASPPRAAEPELALTPAHAAAAQDLARRERQIRERLQAFLGERAAPQQAIRQESLALGRDLADFRDRVRPLSDRAQYPAQEAANHLGIHAPQAMDQGIGHLDQGQARSAREDQRRAAELLERGAQLADDMAAALRAERLEAEPGAAAGQPPAAGRASPAQALGDARDQMRRASRGLDQARDPALASQAAPLARQAMRQAARDLQAAAELADQAAGTGLAGLDDDPSGAADLQETQEGPASAIAAGSEPDPTSKPGGKADPDLAELKEMVRKKTGRAWGELPGHLRNEILQMQAGRYRDDYARLIQLYFREIAAGASTAIEKKNVDQRPSRE